MSISVVICTYNRPERLSRTVEAVARQKGIDEAEVVVVDDGSDGDFKAIERNWRTKLNFRYIKIRHKGRAGARNRGVKAAEGRRVILLDDDVVVRPKWLERHVAVQDPKLAVLGPYPIGKPRRGAKPYPPLLARHVDPVRFDRIENCEDAGFKFFATGNLSLDREFFLELGGFDERFKHYGWEDIDFGYRFERAGGRLMFDERAKAMHDHRRMTRRDLWAREFAVGLTAYQFWSKWQNEDVEFVRWWGERPKAGPAWRRLLGRAAVGAIEPLAPSLPVLEKLYERLIYAYRHAGAAEGRRLYGESMRATPAQRTAEGSP